jgi:CubicO group peptidase (beta-lactamase class C family)
MSKLGEINAWLVERLPQLLAEHELPGAAVAVGNGDVVIDTAAGVLSTATGIEATPDSLFQIGSIAKVWTTTLAMQLVDEGKLDLDLPVRTYLPEFQIGDEAAATRITIRQLMCHVSGFEGDVFTDTGRGDDCLEKYVATLADVPQLFDPGAMFSYNNAGFSVLGRVVELLRNEPYDDCLRKHLFTPLQLEHAAAGPYEAILHRAAVGHIRPDSAGEPQPTPVWALTRSLAPAGAMMAMSPRDLLAFARMHMRGSRGSVGSVLSTASVKAMQQRQVELPDPRNSWGIGMGTAWGLGWEIYDFPGGTVIGHDGGTIGQTAFLRAVPERDIAVAVLTNGYAPSALYLEIVGRVLRELADVDVPAFPSPDSAAPPPDASRYLGTYSSPVMEITVTRDDDGRVWMHRAPKGHRVELGERPERLDLLGWRGDTLMPATPKNGMHVPHAFIGDDGAGHARYLHFGRALRRVDA